MSKGSASGAWEEEKDEGEDIAGGYGSLMLATFGRAD